MAFNHTVASVQQLQDQITGNVLTSDNPGYEQTRRGWNLAIDHHPALILLANDAQDIGAGIRFAREAGLGVAVQLT